MRISGERGRVDCAVLYGTKEGATTYFSCSKINCRIASWARFRYGRLTHTSRVSVSTACSATAVLQRRAPLCDSHFVCCPQHTNEQ
eukprot:217321-Pleurochrysis_carterae.AAC.1